MGFSTLPRNSFVNDFLVPGIMAFSSIIMSCFQLVPGRVAGLVSVVLWHCVSSWFPPSFLFQLGFRDVPGLVSLLFFFPFSGRGLCSIVIFWLFLVPGSSSGACLPSFFFQEWGAQRILFCAWTCWKHGLLLFGVYAGVIPQQRKLMGSSAQISSGVCRCGSQEQVPEEGSGEFRRVLV